MMRPIVPGVPIVPGGCTPRAELNTLLRLSMIAERCYAQGLSDGECLLHVAQTRAGSALDRPSLQDVIRIGKRLFDGMVQSGSLKAET